MDAVGDRRVDATISAEVVQEILHRYVAIRRPEIGIEIARGALSLFGPVLPVTHGVVARMPDLVARYPQLTSRDLIHVATCIEEGIEGIVTTDRGFDAVTEVRRIAPEVLGA
jgi:predicted nucleic acid-binding protein